MPPGTITLILAAVKLGTAAMNQIELLNMDELPPEVKQELLDARDAMTMEIRRLDSLGG